MTPNLWLLFLTVCLLVMCAAFYDIDRPPPPDDDDGGWP